MYRVEVAHMRAYSAYLNGSTRIEDVYDDGKGACQSADWGAPQTPDACPLDPFCP